MTINASANLSVQIPGGPSFSVAWSLVGDAYDRLTVAIPHDSAAHSVELQPSPGTHVLLLVITSSAYSTSLKSTLPPGAGGHDLTMTQPLVISGSDIVNTLAANPTSISFTNSGTADVTVELLIFRKAA